MSAVERVNKAWDRIDSWYAKNKPDETLTEGVTDEQINAVEKHIKLAFPEELRVSLKRHNGFNDWPETRGYLFPLDVIQSEWQFWCEAVKEGDFDDCPPVEVPSDGSVQETWWCEGLIPIDGGDGIHNVIDLAPGPKGRVGQILFFNNEEGLSKVYPDYASYLEHVADSIEKQGINGEGDQSEEEGAEEAGEGEEEDEDEEDKKEKKVKI